MCEDISELISSLSQMILLPSSCLVVLNTVCAREVPGSLAIFSSHLTISVGPTLKDSDLIYWDKAEYLAQNSPCGSNVKAIDLFCDLTADFSSHFPLLSASLSH